MRKTNRFRVLTPEQYERLSPEGRLAYIEEAFRMTRLGRAEARRASAPHGRTSLSQLKKAKAAKRSAK